MLKGNCVTIPKKDFKQYLFDNYSTAETIQMYENSALSQAVLPAPFPDPEDDMPEDVERPPQFEVHVKNLPFTANKEAIQMFFEECGKIKTLKFTKGRATIGFSTREEQQRAYNLN